MESFTATTSGLGCFLVMGPGGLQALAPVFLGGEKYLLGMVRADVTMTPKRHPPLVDDATCHACRRK